MRTTVSLDDDVAVRFEQLRRALDRPLREVVTEALRQGLIGRHESRRPAPYRTRSARLKRLWMSIAGGSSVCAMRQPWQEGQTSRPLQEACRDKARAAALCWLP